jgi:hypothetical protein
MLFGSLGLPSNPMPFGSLARRSFPLSDLPTSTKNAIAGLVTPGDLVNLDVGRRG